MAKIQKTCMEGYYNRVRQVLEWKAAEVAEWLNLSVAAVNSALQRARRVLQERHVLLEQTPTSLAPLSLQTLLESYVTCWEQGDIPGLVALLREDAWLAMPPTPAWFHGRMAIAALLSTQVFLPDRQRRLLPTRANGSPAFGLYQREGEADVYQLFGLLVLEVVGEQIGSLVAFLDLESVSFFALPPILPCSVRQSNTDDDSPLPSSEP